MAERSSKYIPLILGSNSPRRRQILKMAGYEFEVMVSMEEERTDLEMDINEIPVELARQKASHILPGIDHDDFILLTADTVVILDGKIIGKPIDLEDAKRILTSLSGRIHEVVSGVCICNHSFTRCFHDLTRVHFGTLTEDEIDHYINHYEVLDKAGAYAVQEGIGLTGIDSIEGSFYNVMGLPVHKVYRELSSLDIYPAGLL